VTVESGADLVVNTTVPYAKPATVDVTVTVNGLPADSPVLSSYAVLCPVGIPFDGVTPSFACIQGGVDSYPPYPPLSTPGEFVISGAPAGRWIAYPGYCTQFGCAAATNGGTPVTTVADGTTTLDLSTGFLVPPNGLLTTTASVVGAPAGFDDPVGVSACQISLSASYCDATSGLGSGPASMILPDGIWAISAFYTVPPFGNAISGPTQIVVVRGGRTTTRSLVVPYQVLGTAAGTIKITGKPAGLRVTSYSINACPVGLLNPFSFLSCVDEYSGPGSYSYGAADPKRFGRSAHRGTLARPAGAKINTFDLPTLTPGQWDLQVTYQTQFGYFSPPDDTVVNVTAGQTTTATIKVPYQQPQQGIVKGALTLSGIGGGFNAGVRACDSAPVGGTCTDEVDATLGSGSSYLLTLFPGTWWVQGYAYVYGGLGSTTITSPAEQITVTAGSQTRADFTVTGS